MKTFNIKSENVNSFIKKNLLSSNEEENSPRVGVFNIQGENNSCFNSEKNDPRIEKNNSVGAEVGDLITFKLEPRNFDYNIGIKHEFTHKVVAFDDHSHVLEFVGHKYETVELKK